MLLAMTFIFHCAALPPCNSSNEDGLLTNNLKDFVIFAGSGYTFAGTTNSSFLNGNIASFPTSSALSGNTMVTLNGTEDLNATETNVAAQDVTTTFNNAVAKPGRNPISGDIGGLTMAPGVYFSETTIGITGNLTLDAKGNSSAVFIFIAGSAFFTDPNTNIILKNSAQACHVYWIVGSSATINLNNTFIGTINAYASISIAAASKITGHLFARQAVTVDSSTVSLPFGCVATAALLSCEPSIVISPSPSTTATSSASTPQAASTPPTVSSSQTGAAPQPPQSSASTASLWSGPIVAMSFFISCFLKR